MMTKKTSNIIHFDGEGSEYLDKNIKTIEKQTKE